MKIVMAYHRANEQAQRLRFVSRERAYHGVNMGGVSLAGMVKNRETFPVTLPNVVTMRHTHTPEQAFTKGQPDTGAELAEDLVRICETYGGSTIAAVFVEPIAGSTGTLVPPVGYLKRLREICDEHGILLVFDEVITGFGRTGKGFASETYGVTPDIITMAKALTNGAIPMGAVAVKDEIDGLIEGSGGALRLNGFGEVFYRANGAVEEICLLARRDWPGFSGDCVFNLISYITDCLQADKMPVNNAREYLALLALEEQVYNSAEQGKKLPFPPLGE